jgi:16S rRNA G966 N2-methylase RsmD
MRESVFATLGDLSGLSFLDLFAGSGIIALEAASRGAFPIACVEKDPGKFPILLRNVSIAEERIECKSMPVERFLLRNKVPYSVVFCDPPFPYRYRVELLRRRASWSSTSPTRIASLPTSDASGSRTSESTADPTSASTGSPRNPPNKDRRLIIWPRSRIFVTYGALYG